ncbi:disease resistance protein RUN1-like isoform X2 [Telopea speciosissima]|uniref:disease resistance protein RUN1-like isoform X2 n=1 Tax=Telopea speciosissima TaxID=54955 RepID=UPI001CC508D3|nr:disease resistance protein RUN1-like isoform X2 [Telopea speciosissima]
MGTQIVREESIEIPGKRSRLWFRQDTFDVLTKCMGTKAVEGIALDLSKLETVNFDTEAFAEMSKLRLLQVNYVHLLGDYKHLSKELRWLCWHGFPLKSIPTNFHMENLVFLDMQHSNIREFSKESKLLKKLKVLNLSHSLLLQRTPNFIRLPNLEKLILKDCNNLVEVHQSIGNLHKLVLLNLQDCRSLKNLPVTICNLTSLENLTLSGCSKLDKLPEELGNMGSLKELLADRTAIKQVPFSMGHCRDLKSLSLGWFKGSPPKSWHSFFSSWGSPSKVPDSFNILPASFSLLRSLKSLILKGCNLSEGAIPSDLGTMSSLEVLNLGYNNFCSLPANISCLSHLRSLQLRECRMLQSLPELPSSLEILYANGCTSLQSLPDLGSLSSLVELDLGSNEFFSLPSSISGLSELVYLTLNNCTRLQSLPELPSSLRKLNLEGCTSIDRLSNLSNLEDLPTLMLRDCDKIVEIQDLEKMESVRAIHLEGCNNLSNAFKESVLQALSKGGELNIFLPASAIPEWFSHKSPGSSMSFKVPPLSDDKIQKLLVCAVYAAEEVYREDYEFADAPFLNVNNKTRSIKWRYCPTSVRIPILPQDHMWVGCIPATEFGNLLGGGDEVEVSIEMEKQIKVKKCGIHLAIGPYEECSESDDQVMIQYNYSSEDDVFDTDGNVSMVDHRGVKRSHDEIGPSSSWSDEEQDPKWLTDEGEREGEGGYSSYFKLFPKGFLKKLYGEGSSIKKI